eukprot:Selendium_serpulae@DN6093_c1_g1_i1.p2
MEGEGPLSPQAWSREDQSFFGTKRKQLLVLIIIEAISAFITLVWDVILIRAIKPSPTASCEFFLSHIPYLELMAYIVTRVVGTLLPHWAIIFVFYWADRVVYEPLRHQWDIQLGNLEIGPIINTFDTNPIGPHSVETVDRVAQTSAEDVG